MVKTTREPDSKKKHSKDDEVVLSPFLARRGRPRKGEIVPKQTDNVAKLKAASGVDKTLSLQDVTRLLGISSVTAQKWLREGRFVGVKWSGNRWAFDPDFKIKEPSMDEGRIEIYKRLIPG